MIRTYRMWLYVRIVEQYCIGKRVHPTRKNVTDIDCGKDFVKLRTLFRRRNYTAEEAMVAYSMAINKRYVGNDSKPIGKYVQEVSILGDGFTFATPSGLLNAMAASIGQLSAWVTVTTAIAALVVSIFALRH